MDYRKSVFKAMNFISSHLDDNPTLAEVAGVASLSPFHFHRIFKALTGETIASFTRRLRLERIARSLVDYSNDNVTELAIKYGYSSSQNFAKVFRQHFGCSPSEYRQVKRAVNNRKIGNDTTISSGYDGARLYWEQGFIIPVACRVIKDVPARHVVFMRQIGPYGKAACEKAHAGLLELLGGEHSLHPTGTLALYWDIPDVTEEGYCRTDICIEVSPYMALSRHMATQYIAGGRYAVCSFSTLTVAHLTRAWDFTFRWLIMMGLEYKELPCYELYHSETNPIHDHYVVDIYIPIKNDK